jgi:hypothetical protein
MLDGIREDDVFLNELSVNGTETREPTNGEPISDSGIIGGRNGRVGAGG